MKAIVQNDWGSPDVLEFKEKELIESGEVTPVIDRTYPLRKTAEALRYVGKGHARGKVVITVTHDGKVGV